MPEAVTQEAVSTQQAKRRAYIGQAVGLLFLGLLAWYLYSNRTVLASLHKVGWQQVLLIVALDACIFATSTAMDISMIHRLNRNVSFRDCYLLTYANNFLNRLLPTVGGGAVFRAMYLRRKYGFSYTNFISTIAGLYVIGFLVASVIGLASLALLHPIASLSAWLIGAAFSGLAVCCSAVILFSPRVPESSNRLLQLLKSIADGWNLIKHDSRFVLLYVIYYALVLAMSAAQIMISYQALGIRPHPVSMLLLSALAPILLVLSFTPDGLGIREGVYVFLGDVVRVPADLLVLGSLVLRGISICSTFMVGAASYYVLAARLRRMAQRDQL